MSNTTTNYKKEFIEFVLEVGALKFGEFTLKSGRISPYFFNAGLFNSGEQLAKLGEFYASAINDKVGDFDVLFGPAYKGIPLTSTTSVALFNKFNKNINYSFNRKEAKDHGEGGNIVGSALTGNVVIIDDVISAGTAIGESMELIKNYDCKVKSVIVAMDRQEKGKGEHSAIDEVRQKFGIEVFSIINLDDLIDYIKQSGDAQLLTKVEAYRSQYGV
jgi:orotate phosphoribosyltransferase